MWRSRMQFKIVDSHKEPTLFSLNDNVVNLLKICLASALLSFLFSTEYSNKYIWLFQSVHSGYCK